MRFASRILLLVCVLFVLVDGMQLWSQQDDTPAVSVGPEAVKVVLKHFVINPLAKEPNTQESLHRDGKWSISKARPASCPHTTQTCVAVFYSVPAQSIKCSWAVALNENGSDGSFLDENEDADKYMLRRLSDAEAKPLVKSRKKAVYPPIAIAARVSGAVVLDVLVDTTGNVQNARVVSGPAMLQQATLDAGRAWTFTPLTLGGKAQPFELQLTFSFTAMGPSSGGIVKATP